MLKDLPEYTVIPLDVLDSGQNIARLQRRIKVLCQPIGKQTYRLFLFALSSESSHILVRISMLNE
jgi:hypothetical protein